MIKVDPESSYIFTTSADVKLGFFGASPQPKPTVTGSRGGNEALASLLNALSAFGLITDNTTP